LVECWPSLSRGDC